MNDQIIAAVAIGVISAFAIAITVYIGSPAAVVAICIIGTAFAFAIMLYDD